MGIDMTMEEWFMVEVTGERETETARGGTNSEDQR